MTNLQLHFPDGKWENCSKKKTKRSVFCYALIVPMSFAFLMNTIERKGCLLDKPIILLHGGGLHGFKS